jgi:hypothetical protein
LNQQLIYLRIILIVSLTPDIVFREVAQKNIFGGWLFTTGKRPSRFALVDWGWSFASI